MNISAKQSTQAFIWSREFPKERLQKIGGVQRVWESLFGEPGDRGHYARFHWLGLDDVKRGNARRSDYVAPWEGKNCKIHLEVRTARTWFARKVYLMALEKTRARYPRFDEHHYLDGPRAGERVLEFLSEEHDLARGHLWTSLWKTIEDEKPTVTETCIVEGCSKMGYAMPVAATMSWNDEFDEDGRRIRVVLDRKEVTEDDFQRIYAALDEGRLPEIDVSPVAFSFDDIREGFIELSVPELAVLNSFDTWGPLNDADRQLFEAVYSLDRQGIERAVELGARLNRVDKYRSSAISQLITSWGDHIWNRTAPENERWQGYPHPEGEISESEICSMIEFLLDQGAHPDIHGFDEAPAIVEAALGRHPAIVELLLRRGANAAIDWASDSWFGEWPQAWDSPSFRAFQEGCPEARRVYDLLILNRPSPNFTKSGEDEDKAAALGLSPIGKVAVSDESQDSTGEFEDGENDGDTELQEIVFSPEEQVWVEEQGAEQQLVRQCLVRYAKSFNSLDVAPLIGLITHQTTYESQSVFDTLTGRKRILEYFRGKFVTIHEKGANVLAELAALPGGQPCVALYQPISGSDSGADDSPAALMTITTDTQGRVKSFLMITAVPSPSLARKTGIFPRWEGRIG